MDSSLPSEASPLEPIEGLPSPDLLVPPRNNYATAYILAFRQRRGQYWA